MGIFTRKGKPSVKSLLWLLLKLYALCCGCHDSVEEDVEGKNVHVHGSLRVCCEAWQEACIHVEANAKVSRKYCQNVAAFELCLTWRD
ncbi:hypothetical protein Plhal703r1_c80g0173681 [Plasmopara halstedii]